MHNIQFTSHTVYTDRIPSISAGNGERIGGYSEVQRDSECYGE